MLPRGTGSLGVTAGVAVAPLLPKWGPSHPQCSHQSPAAWSQCQPQGQVGPCLGLCSLGACPGHRVWGLAAHSFALPPLGEQSPQPSQHPREDRRRPARAETLPVLLPPCKHPPPSPQLPASLPPALSLTQGLLRCPPCQLPTRGSPSTGRGSRGQRWKKATSRRAWHRVRILPGFEPYSSHALPPLFPRAGPNAGSWGGGAPGR